ncbi:MAG TPA: glycosyltransferase family 2 protein [Candidatus Cryosericum sp.]|nr:glycosyltransferase family 2 protein [Candidatus Cryosericum sp.]
MHWLGLAPGTVLITSWLALGALLVAGSRRVRLLAEVLRQDASQDDAPPRDGAATALPALSIIVTARNEAGAIEGTVERLLRQRYPGLQVIVVDDRSTDGTSGILDRLKGAAGGRLDVVHNRELPPGWLGKCHACRTGAERARGDFLLFLDGDVALADEHLLARVLRYAERRRIDHLAVVPDLRPVSPLQAALLSAFDQVMLVEQRAFEMDLDLPRGGGGVGAFNLIRRGAYERIGGHQLLRMEIADDHRLGILLKESGARQRIMSGLGLVRCPWHRGALGTIRGLEKNLFAGLRYSVPMLVVQTVGAALLHLGPALLALFGRSFWATVPLLVQALILLLVSVVSRRRLAYNPLALFIMYPLSLALFTWAVWNSALATLRQGGVLWRDTFYPLADLRAGAVPRGAGRRYLLRLSDGPAGGRRPSP